MPHHSRTLRSFMLGLACMFVACGESPLDIEDVQALQAAGRFQESIEPLRSLIAENPDDPRRLYLYAVALWSTNKPGLALWALRGAMDDPEYLLPAGKLFVQALIHGESFDDAEAVCNQMLDELGENADVLALRAEARQASRKNYEGAIEDADRVLEIDPDNTKVLITRTVSLLALRRVEEAGKALRELDDLYRDESLGLKGSGKFCTAGAVFAWEKREIGLARERFQHCLEEFPDNSILLPKALAFFDEQREFERTVEILRAALEVKPDSPSVRENLALRLKALDRPDEALAVLREATEQPSALQQIQAWSTLAAFHSMSGKVDQALAAYEEALSRITTRSPELDFRYADTLIHAKRYEDAMAWADRYMAVPSHRSLIRGRVLLAEGRPQEALAEFGEGNRLWPNNAIARYYTAVAAEQAGELDRTVEEYRYSVRIDPTATDAPLRLGHYYLALGDPGRAVSILSMGLEGNPDAPTIQMMLARVMAYRGMWHQAPRSFAETLALPGALARASVAVAEGIRDREGVEAGIRFLEGVGRLELTNPRDAHALVRLVGWLPEVGRAEDALELARKAREARPDVSIFQTVYAEALLSTGGDPEAARGAYEKALELETDNVVALRGLAGLLADRDSEDARIVELYEKAIELDPGDALGSKSLAALLEARGRRDEAIEVLEQLFERHPWDPEASLLLATALLDRDTAGSRERASRLVRWARPLLSVSKDVESRLEQLGRRLESSAQIEAI